MAWILDLDGVVWLADQPIAGSADAIALLKARGERVLLLTNNSSLTVGQYLSKLERMGIPTSSQDLITSAQAVATLVRPGQTALVCAGPGVEEALHDCGVRTVREGEADVVVVGWHRDFDFERMTVATRAARRGARLVATNSDATYPAPEGLLPGCGAILASVVTAAGKAAEVAGKPNSPMVELLKARLGGAVSGSTLVGDRPDTDGRMARNLGARFALVLSGVTSAGDLPLEPAPDLVAPNLAALVEAIQA